MSGESFLSLFDMSAFYEKRLLDYIQAQRPAGGFTETAPYVGLVDGGLGQDAGPIGWATVCDLEDPNLVTTPFPFRIF